MSPCAPVLRVLLVATLPLVAQPVAMVADCQPRVSFRKGPEVRLLDEITPGRVLVLERGARLVLLHMRTGDELRFVGPGQVSFDPQGNLKGAKPEATRRLPSLQGAPRVRLQGLIPAATLMRGDLDSTDLEVVPVGPAVLTERPTFHWRAVEGVTAYRFKLYDGQGNLRLEREVTEPRLALGTPDALQEGERYTWVLEAKAAGMAPLVGSGRIRLLEKELRVHVERVRPAANAPFSERLVYAALLDELRLHDEAQRLWKDMAAERPDSPSLKRLADR